MNRVIVSRSIIGLCFMQVCAVDNATDEEILKVCNDENPSGTTNGWCEVAREDYLIENMIPIKCESFPNRKHFMVIC